MKILIPVDGSEQSDAALDFVASRSTLTGQKPDIQLINVQPTLSARVTHAIGKDEAKSYQRSQAEQVLDPAVARLQRAGVAAKASFVPGTRSDAVGAAAVRGKADLIVMGSRGHSGLKGLLFGSMTNAVLAGCTKPLLILRSAKTPQRDSLKVGIAVDGSRYGQAAIRWAVKHQALFGAEPRFELLHVLDGGLSWSLGAGAAARRPARASEVAGDDHALAPVFDKVLAAALKPFVKAGLQAEGVRLLGSNAGDAIAAYARKQSLDVLVMGSHGHGAFKSMVLGSVAMRVAARCDKPLLLIRESRPQNDA